MTDTPSNQELVAGLIRLLTVEKRAADVYAGPPQTDGIGRVFGGQVLAQALLLGVAGQAGDEVSAFGLAERAGDGRAVLAQVLDDQGVAGQRLGQGGELPKGQVERFVQGVEALAGQVELFALAVFELLGDAPCRDGRHGERPQGGGEPDAAQGLPQVGQRRQPMGGWAGCAGVRGVG